MIRHEYRPWAVLSLGLALLLVGPTIESYAFPDTVTVATVVAVDAFVDADGTRWGLLGITTPKSRAVSRTDCVSYLRTMILGETVVLLRDTAIADRPGKTPQRLVYLGDELVNLTMIADGFASPSRTMHSLASSFVSASAEAKSAGHGAHAREKSTAEQCSGRTKKGHRCRRMTTDLSGRCWQH